MYYFHLVTIAFLFTLLGGLGQAMDMPESDLEKLPYDIHRVVFEFLPQSSLEIVSRTSRLEKEYVEAFCLEPRVLSYTTFPIHLNDKTSIVCSPGYYCIFNGYMSETEGEVTHVDYFHRWTLAQHEAILKGYQVVSRLKNDCACSAPQGIVLYQHPTLKYFHVADSGITFENVPINIPYPIKTMACCGPIIMFYFFPISYTKNMGMVYIDLSMPNTALQYLNMDYCPRIQCFGDKFLAQTYTPSMSPLCGNGHRDSQFHLIRSTPIPVIEKSFPCGNSSITLSVDSDSDALLYMGEYDNGLYTYIAGMSSNKQKFKQIDFKSDGYETSADYLMSKFLVKGYYMFWISQASPTNVDPSKPKGAFTIYDLRKQKIEKQDYLMGIPKDMHLLGTNIFIPTLPYEKKRAPNVMELDTNSEEEIDVKDQPLLHVIDVRYWIEKNNIVRK